MKDDRGTSATINIAVGLLRRRIEGLHRLEAEGQMGPEEEQRLIAMVNCVANIESYRLNAIVTAVAGRRGLDRLPAIDREAITRAIMDIESVGVREIDAIAGLEPVGDD